MTLFSGHTDTCLNVYSSLTTEYCPDCTGDANTGLDLLVKALALIPQDQQTLEHDYFQSDRLPVTEDEIEKALSLECRFWLDPLTMQRTIYEMDMRESGKEPYSETYEGWDHAALARQREVETGVLFRDTIVTEKGETADGAMAGAQDQQHDEDAVEAAIPSKHGNFGFAAASLRQQGVLRTQVQPAAPRLQPDFVIDFSSTQELERFSLSSNQRSTRTIEQEVSSQQHPGTALTAVMRNLSLTPFDMSTAMEGMSLATSLGGDGDDSMTE